MNVILQSLFEGVTEDLSEYEEDDDFFDIPEPPTQIDEEEGWETTWLDGIDLSDVEGYGTDDDFWGND